jgi:hypothetical protein
VTAKFEKEAARFNSLEDRIPAIGLIASFEALVIEMEKKLATVQILTTYIANKKPRDFTR